MNDLKIKILTYDEMIKAGVMPWDNNSHDMNQLLSVLSAEEQRKARRKFRKLWRKKLKAEVERNTKEIHDPKQAKAANERAEKKFGKGQKPTKEQRRRRRELLKDEFVKAARERANKLKATGEE